MIASYLFAVALLSAPPSAKAKGPCDTAAILAAFDSLYSIKGKSASDRVAFHKKPVASAADKITLGIGDQILVGGPKTDDFRCAVFGDPSGELITGFIPVANLQKIDRDETSILIELIRGRWRSGARSIEVEARGDSVVYATVKGKGDAAVLEDEARVDVKKIELAYDDDDEKSCRVTVERRGPYLLAKDNGHCAQSAGGLYAKVAPKNSP
jgi:hypothetical protein